MCRLSLRNNEIMDGKRERRIRGSKEGRESVDEREKE